VGRARFVFNTTSVLPPIARNGDSASLPDLDQERTSGICWRLLSPNNRQLGRSADVFDDLAACVRAVDLFLAGLDHAEPLVTRQMFPVRWTWRVFEGSSVVAMSGRWFESQRQAIRTLDNFLASAGLASVVPEVMGLHGGRVW
jgi:hypothetical protein